jgi:glycosyltransferase involved in cell wall biosynthesis
MRVLMLAQSPVVGDARVVREAHALRDAGYEVSVIGRGVGASLTDLQGIHLLDAGRSVGLGRGGAADSGRGEFLFRAARWTLLPEHRDRVERAWRRSAQQLARDLPIDIVHAHDRNTLELGVLLAQERGVPLVYDAHELWSDRGLPGRPRPFADRRQTDQESAWARRADLVLTVSEGIAEVLRGRGMTNVEVIRNTFPVVRSAPSSPPAPRGLLYAGRVGPGRDLETLLTASQLPGMLQVSLMGPEDRHFAARLPVPSQVRRLGPASVDQVDALYLEHGIAAITLTARCRNHLLALPNKIFHAVRAGVPVVAADLPEIKRLVLSSGIGALYTPGDAESLSAATVRVRESYTSFAAAVQSSRQALSWDVDQRRLLDAYSRLPSLAR